MKYMLGFMLLIFMILHVNMKYIKDSNSATQYLKKGETKKAINIYSDFIDDCKGIRKSLAYLSRGRAYFKIQKYDDALKDFLALDEIGTLTILNLESIATVYLSFKEYDRAFKYFSRIIELKPKSSLAYVYLGSYYSAIKEYDKAILNYNKALKFQRFHLNGDIQTRLADVYIKLKQYDKADQYLSKALKFRNKSCSTYRTCAILQEKLGNIKLSKTYILKAIDTDKCETATYKFLAELNLIEDNFTEFYKNFEIFSSKRVSYITSDELNDSIYNKVKDDEKFKLLIKNKNENVLTFNDLNVFVNDDEILSSKRYKRQKNTFHIKTILSIMLIAAILYIVYKIGTSCNVVVQNLVYLSLLLILWLSTYIRVIMYVGIICFVIIGGAYFSTVSTIKTLSPHKTTAPKSTTIRKPTPIKKSSTDTIDEVYNRENIDKNKIVFNNAKYKVSLTNTNVKVNEYVRF